MAPASVTGELRKGLRYYFGEQTLPNFAGGLNLRDAPTELALNESPDMWNVTLDERGGIVKRLGTLKWNVSAAAALFTYGFHSKTTSLLFWYSKSDGKLYSDPGNGTLTLRRTWTSGSAITMVDFVGRVYAIHPIDGLYSSADGVTWTLVVATSGVVPVGSLMAVWQNKLQTAGDPANALRLKFCAAGDATKWATADGGGTNDIREKDDSPIVALYGGIGFDALTKPSLIVFKRTSTYRVYDSTTGAYVTLDGNVGAASAQAMVGLFGRIVFVSQRGIYETDGLTKPAPVGDKLLPAFDPNALDYSRLDNAAAGFLGDRVFFSLTRKGATVNDLCFEFHPTLGWAAAGSHAMATYVTYGSNNEQLLGASPTVTGQLYQLGVGGSDDGASIQSWFETRWFEPLGAHNLRLNTLRVVGRGAFTVTARPDFTTTGGVATAVNITNSGGIYGLSLYGTGIYGGNSTEDYATLHPRNIGRAFKIRVDENSTLTGSAPKLLESGVALTTGAWAVYSFGLQYVPLGLS